MWTCDVIVWQSSTNLWQDDLVAAKQGNVTSRFEAVKASKEWMKVSRRPEWMVFIEFEEEDIVQGLNLQSRLEGSYESFVKSSISIRDIS